MSPKKKKAKICTVEEGKLKRGMEENNLDCCKRPKSENYNIKRRYKSIEKKNFVKACELVSYKAYHNYSKRLNLIYLPTCMNGSCCKQHSIKDGPHINQIPSYAEESFNIEMKTNMWCEALEVCFWCITPHQYLSANVLKNVVEIMLNAHEDPDADFTISHLLEKCQQALSQNFSTHPPCLMKTIRKCYNNFLTSSMDIKENTFTNRTQFGYEKGIVKYCMNRLEYELSSESKDEALVDKYENIPEEMKQSVKGLHWQKEKFEIYEALERTDRIKRLMAVLESIIELLQFDLVIWHSRYSNNMGCHIMRSHRPLMAFILWSDNVLYTGAVNNNCRQMLRIFNYLIHLKYPEEHIRIMTTWLNTIVQTFYICENNPNSDYPNTGKYCNAFAKEFYKVVSDLPHESILKILQRIQPAYMQYLVGALHIQSIMSTKEENIIEIIISFVEKSQWKKYPMSTTTNGENCSINRLKARKIKNVSYYLSKVIHRIQKENLSHLNTTNLYAKYEPNSSKDSHVICQNDVVLTLYITLDAYLDAFSVPNVQELLDSLNERLEKQPTEEIDCIPEYCNYSVTPHFIKQYRSIYKSIKELMLILNKLKLDKQLPDSFKIFEKIGLLEL